MAGSLGAGAVTARQALRDWLAYLENERRSSPRTVRAYGDNVGWYLDFLQQHRGGPVSRDDLGGVQASELRAYLAFRRSGDHPLSPRSLSQALSDLPIVFREVLVLREIEGLSYKQIAQVVRIPVGTVKTRLARARALLQRSPLLRSIRGRASGAG